MGDTSAPSQGPKIHTEVKDSDLVVRRRRQIVDAAVHLFISKGFHKTTTREIAKAAGFSIGTLYEYVNSKEDVLYLVCQAIHSEMEQRLRQAPQAWHQRGARPGGGHRGLLYGVRPDERSHPADLPGDQKPARRNPPFRAGARAAHNRSFQGSPGPWSGGLFPEAPAPSGDSPWWPTTSWYWGTCGAFAAGPWHHHSVWSNTFSSRATTCWGN